MGSILIAQFISTGLVILLIPLSWPITWLITKMINYIALQGLRAESAPLQGNWFGWQYALAMQVSGLFVGPMALAFAYLLAVWVYKPSKEKRARVGSAIH